MVILQTTSLLMIAFLLMLMLTQTRPWVKARIPGKVIQTVPLGFIQRVQFHRASLLALAMGLVLGQAAGWLPTALTVFAALFALAILSFPLKYTFTNEGVAIGTAIFRPWKEFSGINLKTNRIILQNASSFGQLTLFVRPEELKTVLVRVRKPKS